MEVSIIWDNKLVRNYDFSRRERQSLDSWIGNLKKKDTRLYKMLVFTVAGLNYTSNVYANTGLDAAGAKFLGLARSLGYWLCLIMCIIEILKSVINGNTRELGKIIMKYVLMFGALYLVPTIFDWIIELFAGGL